MQAAAPKNHGEERDRSGTDSLLSRLLNTKPSLPSVDIIKPEALANEAKQDLSIAVSQIFGIELTSGSEHSLSKTADKYAEKQERTKPSQEFFDYAREFTETRSKSEGESTIQIRQQIERILVELKNLKDSSEELATVFRDVAIDEVPEKPGVYHLTFFEGFLKLVIKMKDKVEDGVIFAKLFKSRKKEKSYASMAKKGGTAYTLHHDRTPATQTG